MTMTNRCLWGLAFILQIPFSTQHAYSDTRIYTTPESVLSNSTIILHTVLQHESACGSLYQQELTVDGEHIRVEFSEPDDLVCTEQHIKGLSSTFQHELGPLSPGAYKVSVYNVNKTLEKSFDFIVDDRDNQVFAFESPAPGQTVSGIGLIRGWGCDRYTSNHLLQYQIDNGEKQFIPHGSDRQDTLHSCGGQNSKNGWGAVINWNSYAPGPHTVTIWFNGKKTAEHDINIAKHSSEFLRGLSRTVELRNFPDPGDTTTLEWSQANQNFIITDTK